MSRSVSQLPECSLCRPLALDDLEVDVMGGATRGLAQPTSRAFSGCSRNRKGEDEWQRLWCPSLLCCCLSFFIVFLFSVLGVGVGVGGGRGVVGMWWW